MSDVHTAGQAIHKEQASVQLEVEARVPELGAPVWLCPQTVIVGDRLEEGERWDGLS